MKRQLLLRSPARAFLHAAACLSIAACGKVDPSLVGPGSNAADAGPAATTSAPATATPAADAGATTAPVADATAPSNTNPATTAPPATTTSASAPDASAPVSGDAVARPDLAAGVSALAARAKLTARKEGTVDAVWFRGPEGPEATGGTSPVTIRIEPNDKGEASVGVIEEYAGGAGDMWRASAWMAAFSASETLGYMLTDHEFLVQTGGYMDGPSAGMLTTAAMVAILTDTPILANTTMSGTINPDGSAGPVGGLPQKMDGARKKGKTRFGYPVGCRNSKDLRTGEMADLEVVGRDLGYEEVREINDVREAYQFITGKELPPLTLASESDMALDPDLRARVKAKLMSWQADLNGRLPGLNERIGKMKPEVKNYAVPIFAQLQKKLDEANRFEQSGLEVPAYNRELEVAIMFRMCMETVDVLEAMQRGDMAHVEERLDALVQVEGKINALAMELSVNSRKKTVGGQVNSVAAYAYFNVCNVFMRMGRASYKEAHEIMDAIKANKIPKSAEAITQMVTDLLRPVGYFAAADAILQAGRESMDFAPEEGGALEMDVAKLTRLGKAYGSAASAGLAYFDSTVVKEDAKAAGVTMERAQAYYAGEDANYILAPELAGIAAATGDASEDNTKPEIALIRLSAGVMSFIESGGLINKYYSLQYSKQKDGTPVLVQRRALGSQLDLAKRGALAAGGEAKKLLGFIPATARLAFENASAMREGSDDDKLDALSDYWQSAFWSRMVVTLARK